MQIHCNGNVPALAAMCVLFRTGIGSPELFGHTPTDGGLNAARWGAFGRSGLETDTYQTWLNLDMNVFR